MRSDMPDLAVFTRRPVDIVSEPVAKQAIADLISSSFPNMEMARPWIWTQPLSEHHRATLFIQGYKGARFHIEYGVCCTWVPHLQAKTWRWHRTLKQTRNDLLFSQASGHYWNVGITHLHGVDAVREQAELVLPWVAPRATQWWTSVSTEHGVLDEALRQFPRGPSRWSRSQVVAAFTAARLGQADAARDYLRGPHPWPDVLNYDGVLALLDTQLDRD